LRLASGRLAGPRAIHGHEQQQASERLLAAFRELPAVRTLGFRPPALYFLPGAVQFLALKSSLNGSINRLHGTLLRPLKASPSLNSSRCRLVAAIVSWNLVPRFKQTVCRTIFAVT